MALKGVLETPHIPKHLYQLTVIGLPAMTFTAVGGIEEATEVVQLPDRTAASSGESPPVEFTLTQPLHHRGEVVAMEVWFAEGHNPVTPTYKKTATLTQFNIQGTAAHSWTLMGVWVTKRATQDLEMESEGEMSTIEWSLSADRIMPLP